MGRRKEGGREEGRKYENKREILLEILAEDPRPAYIDDSERTYGFPFADCEIKFKVKDNPGFPSLMKRFGAVRNSKKKER